MSNNGTLEDGVNVFIEIVWLFKCFPPPLISQYWSADSIKSIHHRLSTYLCLATIE